MLRIEKSLHPVKRKFRVCPKFVAKFRPCLLMVLKFALCPEFVEKTEGINNLSMVACPLEKGGTCYDRIPRDSGGRT